MEEKILKIWAIAILLIIVSCGKYGYDYKDGYSEGDKDPSTILTDTAMNVADKSLYHRARIFPGLIGEQVKRIADTTVTFNMNYQNVSARDLTVRFTPLPIFSTGLYAPAGENIRIVVPSGVLGLTVQVGVHTEDLSYLSTLRRDPIIYSKQELFPGINFVKNLYGGTLWILTNNSREVPVSLHFSGAVRSPDFILGSMTPQEWIKEVESIEVPWLEIRSQRVVFSVPRSLVLDNKSASLTIDQALNAWKSIYEEDFYKWIGLEKNAVDARNRFPELPERAVLDIQLEYGLAHSGSPWVAQMDNAWYSSITNIDYILNSNVAGPSSWGVFHEIGHNYQQNFWVWNGLEEVTNNLFIWKSASRYRKLALAYHESIPQAFVEGLQYAAKYITKDMAFDAAINNTNGDYIRILPFLQIYNKAVGKNGESGWDFMPYIYNRTRNEKEPLVLDEARRDYFYRSISDFTGRDWRKFFDAWGIRLSVLAKNEIADLYPAIDKDIWTYNPLTNTGGDGPISAKEDVDNTQWSIRNKSSEEIIEEGGTNSGRAIRIIDGNNKTYWSSGFSFGIEEPPHSITFDMKKKQFIKGFYLVPRLDSKEQRPRRIEIRISSDNKNYIRLSNADLEQGYSFEMVNDAERKEFRLKNQQEMRYVQIYFRTENYSRGPVHAVAEFGAFTDID